jgi:hypothetical protein
MKKTAPAHALAADKTRPFESIRLASHSTVIELELARELGDSRRAIRLKVDAREQAALAVGTEDR